MTSLHKRRDLAPGRILVARRFTYFGAAAPPLPAALRFLAVGRAHRCHFTAQQVAVVKAWFEQLPQGVLGPPAHWSEGDASWQQEPAGREAGIEVAIRPATPPPAAECPPASCQPPRRRL